MSANLKWIILITVGALLFTFGCATRPQKIVAPPQPVQEPVTPKAPEPQPTVPTPAPVEPQKEAAPPEPEAPPLEVPAPRSTVPSAKQPDKTAPRTVASLKLTEQARILLDSKRPDDAIGILEKAVNIDTNNGQNYYYLAEAWIMKGNKAQAVEFNRMAGLYLKNDAAWMVKVQQQKGRIDKMKGAS